MLLNQECEEEMTRPTSATGRTPAGAGPGAGVSLPVPASAGGGPISHAIFRLARLHRMHAGQLLRRIGLHPGQELVMMHLWELGAQRQTDLVRLLDSDAATMTRTVQRLEQAGFVRRRPSPPTSAHHSSNPPRPASPCAARSSRAGAGWRTSSPRV
ncbi:hypothetical protein GCM10025734_23870 [Kitasatospora paranensis]